MNWRQQVRLNQLQWLHDNVDKVPQEALSNWLRWVDDDKQFYGTNLEQLVNALNMAD
jgi:hypothetical protein